VIEPQKAFTCSVCGAEQIGLLIMEDPSPVCMACADMDHLVFLARGDTALTRRARAASGLSAMGAALLKGPAGRAELTVNRP
jgi:hypothetical protein